MNKKAFTLIELIVGITISMMLMVSVGIFVNNGMANILTQQKVIKNTTELTEFTSNIYTAINLMQSGSIFPVKTASGIIFKRGLNLGEGGFSYIGTTISNIDGDGNGIYCESGSEDTNTKHIILKNFIPFEEHNSDGSNEDIFNNYTGSLFSTESISTKIFKSYQKENKIAIKKPGNIWETIIGKGIFGNKFEEGSSGKDIYLNAPTGLEKIGNILLISDTLNNRILWYDTDNDKIYKLLDQADGLNEPTGLYYNDAEKALYIANSGNGEILKYSSKKINTAPDLQLTGFSENDINKIEIEFTGSILPNLNTTGDWTVTTNNTSPNYLTGTTNTLTYYFITKNSESNQPSCTGTETKFSNGKPQIYCTKTGSGKTANYPKSTISQIEISNLSNFTDTGSYIVNLKLFNDSTETNLGYFPYFTQSDDNILTPDDNKLEIIESGLNYPTGLWWDSSNNKIAYNEFGKSGRNFSNKTMNYNKSDIILKTPINYLDIYKDNGLVTFLLKYYKKYNCYNLDDKSERTYIFKKNLK